MRVRRYSGTTHLIGGEVCVSATGLPLLSRAGVYRARALMIRQVAESSADEPLDEVTEHSVTLPLGPTVSFTRTVPDSFLLKADDG
jgi:hypothetical protein